MTKTNTSEPVIKVEHLVAGYGKGKQRTTVLKDLSFEVKAGECVGFVGVNGAGKSTTLKMMMGFRFPDAGSVNVWGEKAGSTASRQRIGYLPEVALYYPFMKARELLELYGGLSGLTRGELRERIPAMLEKVGLGGKGEVLLKHFSKGMQQRLGIAQSLIGQPDLLIFDELSSGLDPVGRHDLRVILQELKSEGRTVFFSSHELGEVETLCDRVLMIHQGELIRDLSLEEVQADCGGRSLEAYFIETVRAGG